MNQPGFWVYFKGLPGFGSGSKYPIVNVSGPKYHVEYGFWNHAETSNTGYLDLLGMPTLGFANSRVLLGTVMVTYWKPGTVGTHARPKSGPVRSDCALFKAKDSSMLRTLQG